MTKTTFELVEQSVVSTSRLVEAGNLTEIWSPQKESVNNLVLVFFTMTNKNTHKPDELHENHLSTKITNRSSPLATIDQTKARQMQMQCKRR
jgi:hypothetical protein